MESASLDGPARRIFPIRLTRPNAASGEKDFAISKDPRTSKETLLTPALGAPRAWSRRHLPFSEHRRVEARERRRSLPLEAANRRWRKRSFLAEVAERIPFLL